MGLSDELPFTVFQTLSSLSLTFGLYLAWRAIVFEYRDIPYAYCNKFMFN